MQKQTFIIKMYQLLVFIPALILLSIIGSTTIFAQTDTTFWFAAPEVASSHGDRPIFARFTSQGASAQVTIQVPANSSFTPITLSVPANGIASVELTSFIDTLENFPANTILNQGILFTSTSPITAYYEVNRSNNPDIFALKGSNALGTDFWIPAQTYLPNQHGHNGFDIVATEDGTTVTITPSKALQGGRAAGVPFTVTLNRGQTFSCRANGQAIVDHLNGSRVQSNKKIAITIFDDSVLGGSAHGGGCFDLLGDQLIPVDQLGMEFIVQRGFLSVTGSRRERVYVLATQNSTEVYVNGSSTPVATVNAGEQYEHRLSGSAADQVVYLRTNKPSYVLHVSGYNCETGQAIIPAIRCTGSSQVGFRRSTAEHFGLMILTRSAHVDSFRLNGTPYTASFAVVPGTSNEWFYARMEYPANDTALFNLSSGYILSNSSGNFHLGLINGGSSSGCRYGYFSGFSLVTVTATSNSTVEAPACQASPVYLEADSTPLATYNWTGPNGYSSTLRRIEFTQVTFADTGLYTVTATVDNCISRIDSINIVIKAKPNVAVASNSGPYCDGETIRLFADTVEGVSYLWSGPNGFTSTQQFPQIANGSFANGGTYRLITLLDGCSSDTTTTEVFVHPVPVITPLGATTFCRYDSVDLRTGGGISYSWFKDNVLISGQNDSILRVSEAGSYYAVVINNFGCTDTAAAVDVTVFNLPNRNLNTSTGSDAFCAPDSIRLYTQGGYTYQWFRNDTLLSGLQDSSLSVTVPIVPISWSFNA